MNYTILVATPLTEAALHYFDSQKDIETRLVPAQPEAIAQHIALADALIVRDEVNINAELLDTGRRLKVIGRAGVGLTGIDVDLATKRGIIVMNTPGANAVSTAEYTFTLMLALARQVIAAHQELKEGIWGRQAHLGSELYGKTLGLIGLGRVGRQVAARALAFGMEVLAFDPYVSEAQTADLRVKLLGLDEVLARADWLSLHCVVSPETRHLINAETLKLAKTGVRIINAAHGSIIDERALADALASGKVAGAAVDVFAQEQGNAAPKSPLLGLANVIHTPHLGDSTSEAQHDLSMQIARQVVDALRGTDYRNAINLPFLPGRDFEAVSPYLNLAEQIGALQHYLARGRVRRLAVEYKGEELNGLTKPLTVAMLKGLLAPVLGETVNFINAPLMAMERGIHVTQAKGLDESDYTNLVSCQVHWEGGGQQVITGALFNRREARIINIDDYSTDFIPAGILLIFGSYDVPGVIGRVGMLMMQHQVNIAAWRTGRAEKGGQTLTVLTLDQPLPLPVLEEFRKLEFVRHATQIFLGTAIERD
jgi:D-3-phosphoglycerate dehydrogenase / 2-oxoglutarate reductase